MSCSKAEYQAQEPHSTDQEPGQRQKNGGNVEIPLIKMQIRVCNVHHAQQRSRFSEKMIQKWFRGRTCDA